MHFYIGDTPGVLPPAVLSSLPLDGFTSVEADLVAPDDTFQTVPVALDGAALIIDLPPLAQVGVYRLQIVLSGEGVDRIASPIRIPVEDPATPWHTIDSARQEWKGAPVDDVVLYELLVSAREQVLAYAPQVEGVPVRYRTAQIMQARNSWNAHQRNQGNVETYGADGFQVTVHPLDWHVRQLLRPTAGTPVVG